MPVLLLAFTLLPLLQTAALPTGEDPSRDRTLPPPAAHQLAQVQGKGVQIYTCADQGNGMVWTLQSPEATLIRTSDNVQVGTHDAGPRWTWNDGSSIRGNVVASQPSPRPGNIPSLLVETFPAGVTNGYLSHVIWVRRSDASGGIAPASVCDADHAHNLVRVPYQATYTFYSGSVDVTQP